MATVTIETNTGEKYEFVSSHGICYTKGVNEPQGISVQIERVLNTEILDDDVYLAAYPKSGTHWVWEILMMLRKGTSKYETFTKEFAFLDFRDPQDINNFPSPRVLNCHYPPSLIPRQILEKHTKIVHVQRNAKDVAVSAYHHLKVITPQIKSFTNFLPLFKGMYGICPLLCPWYKYVKDWERFTKQHPGQVFNLHYEDLKENPLREVKRLNEFLGTGCDDELMEQIVDACHFHNLKKASAEVKDTKYKKNPIGMYRKGEVGDWKNWFTVAENEDMDRWLEENLDGTNLHFRYTL